MTLQRRFNKFVTWIRPDPDEVEDARRQRDDVKERIRTKAEADGLTVRSTPNSGSFAKATGLRRHMLGGAEHEGQDIDCSFVVSPKTREGDVLGDLLTRFEQYAQQTYPQTPRERTKSSVRLKFVAAKRSFDLVPLLAVEGNDDEQILLRADGERRRTSVQRHVEFVKARTKRSRDVPGAVAFNDALRLVKWWREYQAAESRILDDVPTFFIELLCAKAFDEVSVRSGYAETLQTWFDKLHAYAAACSDVVFADYGAPRIDQLPRATWRVIDPVNPENNAVPRTWGRIEIDEFRDWAAAARDKLQQAIAFDMRGRDAEAVTLLANVFGPSFKKYSET